LSAEVFDAEGLFRFFAQVADLRPLDVGIYEGCDTPAPRCGSRHFVVVVIIIMSLWFNLLVRESSCMYRIHTWAWLVRTVNFLKEDRDVDVYIYEEC